MKVCAKCLLPQTHEAITYDAEGICSVCNQIKTKREAIDWGQRRQWLNEIIGLNKSKGLYDCIIPFSGGKDSAFQLWFIVKQLQLKPLVVRFDHWGFRPLVDKNNEKVFKILGVDILKFTPNWHLAKALMLEALKRTGDFCWHCHTGIFGHTMQIALRYQVPLVIWGESAAEYGSYRTFEEISEADERNFREHINLGISADQMYDYLAGKFDKRDFYPYCYPDQGELDKLGCRSIYLGNYIQWDTKKHVEIIKRELGWEGQDVEGIPPQYDYEKIECKWQGIRDFCRYIKRGYGRTSHLVAIDIRHDRMTTPEGKTLIEQYDGRRPKSLNLFLEFLGISEQEFYDILKQHQVSPWTCDCSGFKDGKELHDMKCWDRTK